MAKRSIRKTDPETTTAPERRRRTTPEGTAPVRATRSRRKSEPVEPVGAAADNPAALAATIEEIIDAPDFVAAPEIPHEHIAVRAYHIYLSRGARPGDQVADWVAAERELREQAVRAAR
jgi:hypothetical protein